MNEELPDVEVGKEVEVDGTVYINPIPYDVHEHEFDEIEPGVWKCRHCAQGRIGHL